MAQEIVNLKISELRLWTENPRDPAGSNMTDKEIISRAINQKNDKWNLSKLIEQMGDYYDKSEALTVVKKNNEYIVYDGNRRLAIIKYSQNPSWSVEIESRLSSTDLPQNFKDMSEIPCNVCDKKTALINIERKHINSGSWGELERHYFLHFHKGEPKSNFLIIEEATNGMISNNKKMNQRFVRDEILTDANLAKIGFGIREGKFLTNYNEDKTKLILDRIVELNSSGKISTRGKFRRQLLEPLKAHYTDLVLEKFDETKKINTVAININRKTRRSNQQAPDIFGVPLTLKGGNTNNIYRDILDLYKFYTKNKDDLSQTFPSLIRMVMRLLIESAAKELAAKDIKGTGRIKNYTDRYFEEAKETLNKDQKTTLNVQSVTKDKIVSLLHIGAHDYSASNNLDQTMAMSLIIGAMLKISHPKK